MKIPRRAALQVLGLSALAGLAGRVSLGQALGAEPVGAGSPSGPEPDVELDLIAAPGEATLTRGQATRVWRFTGKVRRGPAEAIQSLPDSYLGPVLRLRRGQRVRIHFRNDLGEPSIVHWHGLDVPEAADGHPRFAVGHGQSYVYDFEVTNRAGTYWYHPHPHMRTAAQVYQGLAGLLLVSDPEEEALALPAGGNEVLCVLQDRRLDSKNQWVYAGGSGEGGAAEVERGPGRGRGMGGRGMGMGGMGQMMEVMNGWLGDRMLVNGQLSPTYTVDRGACRVRLLNGSNGRIYKLAWSDRTPMTLLGGDGGLLEKARRQPSLVLGPGQRADVWVDLSDRRSGARLKLVSREFPVEDAGRMGMMEESSPVRQGAELELMTLKVSSRRAPERRLPEVLSRHDYRPQPKAKVRPVPLNFMRMTWFLDGRTFDMQDVAEEETVKAGSTWIWEFENQPNPMGMAMAHPMHVHGPQFRVVSRTGGSAKNSLREGLNDDGWVDTVLILPGEKVRTQIQFSRYPGLYLYHCHILEHEDMGMMRNFRITPA
ncbi:MAG: hypothetical protein RJA22_2535 [Verrucomicrobiota bacterium]|jgi:FtsP/CotA-like multicopper oxidase with cupredoxin domain